MTRTTWLFWAWVTLPCLSFPCISAGEDHLELSLEELINTTVYTASKFPQKSSDAPASVSIITREDIATYGYENLADILASVRGMHGTYDRNYEYLGIRGFGRTGNYNNRFLLLIDGYRINDAIYENAAIGRELFLDVDLIDRVEVVRGPGSSIYGSNAFLGVINVFTKKGRDVDGWQVAVQGGSLDTVESQLTYGRRYDNGLELLVSGSHLNSRGLQAFEYMEPDFKIEEKQFGFVSGLDREHYSNLYARATYGNFSATAGFVDRKKEVPTASFGSVLNQPNSTRDRRISLGLGYGKELSDRMDFSIQGMLSRYVFKREAYYDRINEDLPPFSLNREESDGRWWNVNAKLGAEVARHHLLAGVEFQQNAKQHLQKYDEWPRKVYLNEDRDSNTWAFYVQDEIRFTDKLLLNAGLRYDHYSNFGSTVNPRFAAIYSSDDKTAVKLLYGTAFRAPSEYERQPGVDRIGNPKLNPEEVSTTELIVEHHFAANTRLIVAAYRNDLSKLIELVDDDAADQLVFRNAGRAESEGFEIEAEHRWESGRKLRVSYTWQQAKDARTGITLPVSPRHLAKLNFSTPLLNDTLRAGLEVQYTSSQRTLLTGVTDDEFPEYVFEPANGHTIVNLNLTSKKFRNGLQVNAGISDLFDEGKKHPAGKEHDQGLIVQDGRYLQLELNYRLGGWR